MAREKDTFLRLALTQALAGTFLPLNLLIVLKDLDSQPHVPAGASLGGGMRGLVKRSFQTNSVASCGGMRWFVPAGPLCFLPGGLGLFGLSRLKTQQVSNVWEDLKVWKSWFRYCFQDVGEALK